MTFNHFGSIDGEDCVYPSEFEYVVLFHTADDHYFIYSLFTDELRQNPELAEVLQTTYDQIRSEIPEEALNELLVDNESEVRIFTKYAHIKTMMDDMPLIDLIEGDF